MTIIQLLGYLMVCLACFGLGVFFVRVYDDYKRGKRDRKNDTSFVVGVEMSGVDEFNEEIDNIESRLDNLIEKSTRLTELSDLFEDGITYLAATEETLYATNGIRLFCTDITQDTIVWRELPMPKMNDDDAVAAIEFAGG